MRRVRCPPEREKGRGREGVEDVPAGSASGGAELSADVSQLVPLCVHELGGEGSLADTGAVRLDRANDLA